ncbi:MAG TPA: helicase HerA-like domain-containing protein [Gemmatimonadaceae bacterium]|nr:helicase HerA-like domain-containing protein [Gemmatimonadaceae bacterium]
MNDILIGKGDQHVHLLAKYGNRHGLVAGATGTGKTASLMVMAEGFSRVGVPVFVADVKGDVAGLAVPGTPNPKIAERLARIEIAGYAHEANPVIFWDVNGRLGHPVRTAVSEVGPTLLARILQLNDTQGGILEIVFKVADDEGLLLLDMADLRSLLNYVAENRAAISRTYGLVSPQSLAAIQRSLLALDREGGTAFFGEPALELTDLMRTDLTGRGIISILAADKLILQPRLYSSFMLWLLSELFEQLPEAGDLEKPKLVFVFDEAHLLFDDAPPALRQRVEQVVRIIRSKGVGVYFCSQYPDDVPNDILGQLGNRVQHALRAHTPRDQKAVRIAAETFVANPKLDVAEVISQLRVGEALVSTLQENGVPMPVERTLISPPRSRMGVITAEERATVMARSPVGSRYETVVNRDSAHEMLERRAAESAAAAQSQSDSTPRSKSAGSGPPSQQGRLHEWMWGTGRRQGMVETMAKQTARTVGGQLGRQILRGVLGGIRR